MKKTNRRRRRNSAGPTCSSNKSGYKVRFHIVLWGIVLICCIIAGIIIFKIIRNDSDSSSPVSTAIPKTAQNLESLELNDLTVKEQIAALRAASIELGERLVTDFPRQAESYVLLGNTYRQLGQSTQAADCWNKALKLDAQRMDVYTYLAVLADEKGDAEQALDYWKKVLSLRPNLPGLRDSLANTLMSLNQWDDAIEVLNEEIRLSPESARTHYLLGRAYIQKDRFEEAATHYEKTIALDPNRTEAYYEIATALMRSGQRQTAQHYQRLFRERKQQDKAEASYGYTEQEDLVRAKQTLAGLCAGAANLYEAKNQDKLVLTLLKRIVILEPSNLGIRKRLAARYQALGRLPEALDECEQIARLTPNDPICQMLIGSLSLRMGRYARAESAYKKMISLAPQLSAGYSELAKVYLKTRKNLSQAKTLAQKAVQLDPNAGNYYVLGLAYYENGDKVSALNALKRAIELDPGNQTYQRTYDQLTSGK